ncbi:MAG: PilZ domain-containing protein [Vicinamibacterales bacterium]|nr:PilZ domain-containing protein [Vicinamibacterales bacterium]
MPEADRQERRTHRRAGQFEGAWSGASGSSGVRIADFSEGGCFVESLIVPAQHDRVMVTLALTPSREISAEGHVTKVDPGIGFGVQFTDLEREQRTAIREAVRDMLSGDGGVAVTISESVESSAGPGGGSVAGAVIEFGFTV